MRKFEVRKKGSEGKIIIPSIGREHYRSRSKSRIYNKKIVKKERVEDTITTNKIRLALGHAS